MNLEEQNQKLLLENQQLWGIVNDKCSSAIQLKRLQYDLDNMRQQHDDACALVASMHHAAVHYIGAPKRGVVEDIEDLAVEADRLKKIIERAAKALRRCKLNKYADKLLEELENGI